MLNTVDAIKTLVQGTLLAGTQILRVAIPESDDYAFAIKVDAAQAIAAWSLMKSHLAQTDRYPVLVTSWIANTAGWEQEVLGNDFFSRFYYQEEPSFNQHQNTSPTTIIARVAQVDLAPFLEHPPSIWEDDLEAAIHYALQATAQQFGQAPTGAEIQALVKAGVITSQRQLERWLFDWELQTFGMASAIAPSDTSYLDWYEPDCSNILMLLPTRHSWQSLAYLHWYGAVTVGSEIAMRLLQRWQQHYGAELICHYGTMLQLQVAQRPCTPATAFGLAWEQYALAPYTLQAPGVALRDHARSLMQCDRWFLHERP